MANGSMSKTKPNPGLVESRMLATDAFTTGPFSRPPLSNFRLCLTFRETHVPRQALPGSPRVECIQPRVELSEHPRAEPAANLRFTGRRGPRQGTLEPGAGRALAEATPPCRTFNSHALRFDSLHGKWDRANSPRPLTLVSVQDLAGRPLARCRTLHPARTPLPFLVTGDGFLDQVGVNCRARPVLAD